MLIIQRKRNAVPTHGVFLNYFVHLNRLYIQRLKLFPVSHKSCANFVRCNDIRMETSFRWFPYSFSYLQSLLQA
jgi:hypothetical protein